MKSSKMNSTLLQLSLRGATMFAMQNLDRPGRTQATAMGMEASIRLPLLLIIGFVLSSAYHADAQVVNEIDPTGAYTLVSVDGEKLPATVSHDNVQIEVRAGTFRINADGTCGTKTIFAPPSGSEITREVTANYTQSGSTLTMQWEGAGRTLGTVNGDSFTMDNEGIVFAYRKQPGNEVLERFVGTWRSVQTQRENAGEQNAVDLTYRRILGGKFVQELGRISGQDTAMIMYTHDSDRNQFRLWRFASTDPSSEATGKWLADSNTLEWTYAATPQQNLTMKAKHRFLNDNVFEWEVIGRDNTGKVLFQTKGKATRTNESKE